MSDLVAAFGSSGARLPRSQSSAGAPGDSGCSPRPSSPTGLGRAFGSERPALVAYLMAGYPDACASLEALRAVAAAGADLIELGVPYSDALADGPVISRAAAQAMSGNVGGFGLAEAIALAAEFLGDPGLEEPPPLALMTYLNPVMRMGYGEAARLMNTAGVGGVIIPDMPPDVAEDWLEVASTHHLDTVFLVAPTSTDERLTKVANKSSGFVYAVSTTGVTGERTETSTEAAGLVERMRRCTSLPIAVGFGISTPEQAAAVARICDGVIVGSGIVRRQRDIKELEVFVRSLADAVHGSLP